MQMRFSLAVLAVVVGIGVGGQRTGTAQMGGTQQPAAQHVYRLTASRAVPGRTADLLKLVSAPNPAPSFGVVLRHQEGDEWDFLTIQYMGERATVGPPPSAAPPPGPSFGDMAAWHIDTYAAGPPLDEFRKALNLQGPLAPGRRDIYVVGEHTTAPGHFEQLRQWISRTAADTPGRSISLRHIDGASWQFLVITRYDSWRQLADEQQPPEGQPATPPSTADAGMELRQHISRHHDTIAIAASVISGGPAR